VAHELFQAGTGAHPTSAWEEPPATAGEIDGLVEHAAAVLAAIGFERDSSYEGVLRDLRRLVGRARPDARDVRILRGICRRVQGALPGGRGEG
jgi:tRNA C32,U32 (ribose-2'-O)-methylase TrmJ